MKESQLSKIDDLKSALARMGDALGVNYSTLGDVMETLDTMNADLRPNATTNNLIRLYRNLSTDQSQAHNPVEIWIAIAQETNNVLDLIRLYWEANRCQYPATEILKNRILVMANKGLWK